ncbi:asparagine synthase-domain-containing protein [Hysterangium stoloniferum]|nr:asparagine synthase-domain-containing protein [Hysterangium stoloniferum]
MCGITICVKNAAHSNERISFDSPDWRKLVAGNAARGPDSQNREDVTIDMAPNNLISISFVASTLHLRGIAPVPQPHVSTKNVFCWNGEVFEGLQISDDANDGAVLFAALDELDHPEDIYSFISSIEGPYAFVFYQRSTCRLFFARDPLGRRSLLIHRPTDSHPYLIISSVSSGNTHTCQFEELDPRFIYNIDVRRLYSSDGTVNQFNEIVVRIDRALLPDSPTFAKPPLVNRLVKNDPPAFSTPDELPAELSTAVVQFIAVLDTSIRNQVKNIPRPAIQGARVAVLYSGGIDSTMVAFLANRHIPMDEPIDLLNVAFENPRKVLLKAGGGDGKKKNKIKKNAWQATSEFSPGDKEGVYNVPDRLSGLEELEELRTLCPGRQWNFVEINIDYAESSQTRSVIQEIMLPSRTVMDLSLALALYFAARGKGTVRSRPTDVPEPYSSPAKVLLNGLGSDELLGGYGRHRSAFNIDGWQGVIDELQLELDRLPSRNLGRDDRVISSHGKETRHPFLSLSVVAFVASLPVYLKTDLRLELGVGDKLLLRLAAQKLGLELASRRKKRAMQFGSHSARMETGIGDRDGEKLLGSEA